MLQEQANLYQIPITKVFECIKIHYPNYSYDFKKHQVAISDETHAIIGQLRLPLYYEVSEVLGLSDTLPMALYVAIESGNAAICVMEGNDQIYHTTFSAYMSRKKQGFSQIKYLNKKGKSRAGSRVRLAKTLEFFENINTTLGDLFEAYTFDRIAMGCSATLIPYLHQSKVTCPFDKKDERLYKIPLHIPQANHTGLYGAVKKLMAPVLFYEAKHKSSLSALLSLV